MKTEAAKEVNQFFDQDAIKTYVEDRLSELHNSLEESVTPRETSLLQGHIKELKYLLRAKEYAKNVLEAKKNG